MARRILRKPRFNPLPPDFDSKIPDVYDASRPLVTTASIHFVKPLLVSRLQAAQMLNCCQRSLDYLLKRGEIKTKLLGSKRMIVLSSLEEFINNGPEGYTANPTRRSAALKPAV